MSVRTVALTALVIVAAAAVQFFVCPCARMPGGYLLGDEVERPVEDWSFARSTPLCQVEVRALLPHSVNVNCMASGAKLYLSCARCAGKRWSGTALTEPAARIRIDDDVYKVALERVTDDGELDEAWHARATKVGLNPATPRMPGWWSFRVHSRN